VTFEGAQISPSEHVDLQVCTNIYFDYLDNLRMKCGRGETFASATASSSTTYVDSVGLSWFAWGANLVIPERYWSYACSYGATRCAMVRSIGTGGANWTYANDYSQCPQPLGYQQLTNQPPCALASSQQGGWVTVNASR
jgi:hypothetical protein